jgi:hypothetical protein
MVLAQMHPHIHQDLIHKLSGGTSDRKERFKCYQRALSQMVTKFTVREIEEAKGIAKRWNETAPPPDIQRK